MSKKIKINSLEIVENLVGKRVGYTFKRQEKTGVVEEFEQGGKRMYLTIRCDKSQFLEAVVSYDIHTQY
jgi:hypothetical protein